MTNGRTLTDEDVRAIAAVVLAGIDYEQVSLKVEERIVERFQLETGRAVWGSLKKWLLKFVIWGGVISIAHAAGLDRPFVEAFINGGRH